MEVWQDARLMEEGAAGSAAPCQIQDAEFAGDKENGAQGTTLGFPNHLALPSA